MRKFVPFILKLSVMLLAFSVISQQVTATKGNVERALELLKQARAAIGGESAINSVQSLSINGKSSRQLQLPNQAERELNGEFELNMMLPDKLMRVEKMTLGTKPDGAMHAPGAEGKELKLKDARVKIIRDMEGPEVGQAMRHHEQSEIARYMLGLLLTPPPSFNATYNYVGDGEVSGARADIIEAQGAGGFILKIYLDKTSHLPLMMSYRGFLPRIPLGHMAGTDGPTGETEDKDVVIVRRPQEGEAGTTTAAPHIIFERKIGDENAPAAGDKPPFTMRLPAPVETEIQIRFSDFRAVGAMLLPHIMTQVVGGKVDTIWTVESYEINSPNISEKFSINDKFPKDVLIRTKQN